MTKGKFPNRLAEVMKRVGMGPTELAKRVGTAKQNVSRHMKCQRRLNDDWAKRYAPILGVRPQDLIFQEDLPRRTKSGSQQRVIEVPLVSWVSAGRLSTQDGVTASNVRKTLIVASLPPGNWIALEVEGDSMNRVAPEGSTILVDRSDERLISNRYYVFATETGDATFKQYRAKPFRLQPFSTNPDHETYYPKEELRIIGRVRRVITDV